MSKTTISAQTRFNVPPEINEELLGISDDCLMVQSEHIKLGLNFGFGVPSNCPTCNRLRKTHIFLKISH